MIKDLGDKVKVSFLELVLTIVTARQRMERKRVRLSGLEKNFSQSMPSTTTATPTMIPCPHNDSVADAGFQ